MLLASWSLRANQFEQAKKIQLKTQRLILRFESFSVLFVTLAVADVSEFSLAPNRCRGMSFVYEGRAYKLKHTGRQKNYWRCSKDKEGCQAVIQKRQPGSAHCIQNGEEGNLRKRIAEETTLIPIIYDQEASVAIARPSTTGEFRLWKTVESKKTTLIPIIYDQEASVAIARPSTIGHFRLWKTVESKSEKAIYENEPRKKLHSFPSSMIKKLPWQSLVRPPPATRLIFENVRATMHNNHLKGSGKQLNIKASKNHLVFCNETNAKNTTLSKCSRSWKLFNVHNA
ncbi:hypothetical protein T10_4415 [Trichinella papuae]|uniref:FLYWCH-type domain-containing protein n=1 Tax=Trichinella papuae TaxID=268474 RepID=A0A0V1MLQ9_9BILA|nr:hypothetical protein T10_4415 [Trichinella papuae]